MAKVKATYKEKLLDPRWQRRRLEVLSRDKFACQYCGNTEQTLHVHHYSYAKSGNPWDAEDESLITLCADCHKIIHLEKNMTQLERELFMLLQMPAMMASGKDKSANQTLIYINAMVLEKYG